MRDSSTKLLAAIVIGGLASGPRAEPLPLQAYSYVQDPAVSVMGRMLVKVARDGPLEVVEQTLPAGKKPFRSRVLYDFQAHKVYAQVLSDPSIPCTVMTYSSPAAPKDFDVITGWGDSMKDLLARARPLRKETVNGVSARVVEAKDGEAKQTIWIAEPGGFPVKMVMVPAGKAAVTVLEVKQLRFAKPPASVFTRPSGCKVVAGEATATGGHAELGTGTPASKPAVGVTAVTLKPVTDQRGTCPARIRLTGTITTDGPGKVFYQFGAGTMGPSQTIVFEAAGTKTVSGELTFGEGARPGAGIGVSAILQAAGEDASGNHDEFTMKSSENADFMIQCTGAAAEAAAPAAGPATPASAAPSVNLVELKVTPTRYRGACPVAVKLVGTLKADGPGTAYYQFQAGALGANREGTLQVGADGTATVTSEAQVNQTPAVQEVRFLAGMEPRGNQENAQWADVELDIRCTNAP